LQRDRGCAEPAAGGGAVPDAGGCAARARTHRDEPILGNPAAAITIIEYASMTCAHCAHFADEVLPELKRKWLDTGKAKLVLRDFPMDEPALRTAMIARCAPPERYYAFIDTFFAAQDRWSRAGDYRDALARLAKLGGMSKDQFETCLWDTVLGNKILEGRLVAEKELGVYATPIFFVNGAKLVGALKFEEFDRLLSNRRDTSPRQYPLASAANAKPQRAALEWVWGNFEKFRPSS
jgi:protein-disulfide isomerase